jgi:hypothetical protein
MIESAGVPCFVLLVGFAETVGFQISIERLAGRLHNMAHLCRPPRLLQSVILVEGGGNCESAESPPDVPPRT